MQSNRFLDRPKSNPYINCKKKKKISTNNYNQYIDLESSSSYYKNNHFKIFLLIRLFILTIVYFLIY